MLPCTFPAAALASSISFLSLDHLDIQEAPCAGSCIMGLQQTKLYLSMDVVGECVYVPLYGDIVYADSASPIQMRHRCKCLSSSSLWLSRLYLSASRQHPLPGMFSRRQVPGCGSLGGLFCVVCIISDLFLRVAAGNSGNHFHSDHQDGRSSLLARHHRWYGWVVVCCSAAIFMCSLMYPLNTTNYSCFLL